MQVKIGKKFSDMKKGFTLVELLIVVVVMITLMTIAFRLSSIGSDATARNKTVNRLNRLENCMSGYYAAFGCYPPVSDHGYRNVYLRTNIHGIQNPKQENKSIWGWDAEKFRKWVISGFDWKYRQNTEEEAWKQVQAACKNQPLDCAFPKTEADNEILKAYSQMYQENINRNPNGYSEAARQTFSNPIDNGWTDNPGRHTKNRDKVKWRDVQLFKFGVMSYLLPRYLVMMSFGEGSTGNAKNFADTIFGTYDDEDDGFAQWKANNTLPHNPFTGKLFNGWGQVFEYVSAKNKTSGKEEYAAVSSIPTQAVTARWMPNLEGIVSCSRSMSFYGIDIKDPTDNTGGLDPSNMENMEICTPDGFESNSTSQQYMLSSLTVYDGWGCSFFYYSPPPYQTYTLWSSGKNKRTFAPWIAKDKLDSNAAKCVAAWTEDDIVRMKADKGAK